MRYLLIQRDVLYLKHLTLNLFMRYLSYLIHLLQVRETEPEQVPTEQAPPATNRISQELDYVHFIPLTNSPGNPVKLLLNYTVIRSNTPQQTYKCSDGST